MISSSLLPLSEFVARREKFFASMAENSVALFPAAHEVTRSNDTEYPFCQEKNFYYLTGFNEPDALLVLVKSESLISILFCRDKDPQKEVWHGRRIGPELAKTDYGVDACYQVKDIDAIVPGYLDGMAQLLFCQGASERFDHQVLGWLQQLRTQVKLGSKAPLTLVDCRPIIEEMRLIKSPAEIDIMRKVNQISGQAHQRAMEKTAAGKFEYQIEAELLHEFARHGARYPAYGSIVAGGDNANILHYTDNTDVLKDGELLLIDAGGELAGYAADITRTFPINGTFTEAQKALYQLVLTTQNTVIEQIRPGQTFAQLNELARRVLTEGLLNLGILQGELEQLLLDKACKKYFIHGLGHWLGLDVHDVGDYHLDQERQQQRLFEPGMVMTMEPGLYIPLDAEVDAQYRGIGIRIEDNILVTPTGFENLTITAPKSIAAIEGCMAKNNREC